MKGEFTPHSSQAASSRRAGLLNRYFPFHGIPGLAPKPLEGLRSDTAAWGSRPGVLGG